METSGLENSVRVSNFTYDFANYRAQSTRPDDFKEFWAKTLDDLKQVPLQPEMKSTNSSTKTAECCFKLLTYKVELFFMVAFNKRKNVCISHYVCK